MPLNTSVPVLIVDDSATVRRIVRQILRQCGFNDLAEASDGLQAADRLRTSRFGLVISDVEMAPMNGIELLRAVRRDPGLRDTCFVLMTGFRDAGHVAAAKEHGADALLLKPFTAEMLLDKLAKIERLNPAE
jgi:two-component system chemotaxis response regulator CheY